MPFYSGAVDEVNAAVKAAQMVVKTMGKKEPNSTAAALGTNGRWIKTNVLHMIKGKADVRNLPFGRCSAHFMVIFRDGLLSGLQVFLHSYIEGV